MKRLILLALCVSLSLSAPELIDYALGHPYPYSGPPNKEGEHTNHFPFDKSCPEFCSGHGECIHGVCECDLGFVGAGCETATCPNNCTGHGTCLEGVCECLKGYTARDCSAETCPNMCSGNGRCFQGDCYCETEWKGDDCSIPKWGIAGLSRPAAAGIPDSVRYNASCMVFRIPSMLTSTGPKLTNASVIVKNNQSCVKASMIEGGHTTVTSLEVEETYPPERNLTLPPGDNMICGVFEGCDDIRLEPVYGDRRLVYINGVGVPAPLPPPPLPNQVKITYCADRYLCSGNGVCVNVTLPVTRQFQYECACRLPWIPPYCKIVDHEDTNAPNVDPMRLIVPGQIPFNQVPCGFDDNCFACDEVLSDLGEWTKVLDSQKCIWDSSTSRCSLEQKEGDTAPSKLHMTCRSSHIPDVLLPPPKPKL